MSTLIHDPIGLAESTVIVACLVFYAWWFSPSQRHKRLRVRSRNRMEMRRALAEPTDGADVRARASPVLDSRT